VFLNNAKLIPDLSGIPVVKFRKIRSK